MGNVLEAYHRYIGRDPRLHIPVQTAAGAAAGAALGRFGMPLVTRLMMSGASPEARQLAQMNVSTRRAMLIGMLALGGEELLRTSLIHSAEGQSAATRLKKYGPRTSALFDPLTLQKIQSVAGEYTEEDIHTSTAVSLINRDEFLDPYQKLKVDTIIAGSDEQRSGWTSPRRLTQTAVQAGAGFVPAYNFGRAVGGILALPEPAAGRLAKAGGLAGAIINSGIFNND